MSNPLRMILDVDTGVDDAAAILFALLSPDIKVEGITTGFGNIDMEQATENTLRVIRLANCGYEVPVAAGAAAPLKRAFKGAVPHIHGHNGIGDADLPRSPQKLLEESAADFIIRMASENPGELTLVTVGRLTNLALALMKDPSVADKLKRVFVMGGTVFAPGNATPVSEANLHGDPEAAALVFESSVPLTVVGLDVTQKTRLSRSHLAYLSQHASEERQPIVKFLTESMEVYFDFYNKSNNFLGECPMHDPLAVLVALNPSLVQVQTLPAVIDCGSGLTAGMIITDRRVKPTVGRAVEICVEVDSERAIQQLLSVYSRGER
ncbi:nucleoside hydrolase [Paenibacillus sp. 2TAB19]|uniref:nucleoside hydrolase n=1 Tax=Paenibacillus sp. 2TAB19 TaxID=3233003 RepID=UPI003F9643FA